MNTKRLLHAFLFLALGLSLGLPAGAQAPGLVNYQGRLSNSAGEPVSNRTYEIEFRVWDAEDNGNYIWGEQYTVFIKGGVFNVLLGNGGLQVTNPVTPAVNDIRFAFTEPNRYLELTPLTGEDGNLIPAPEAISPRQQFLSAPFALHSDFAIQAENATLADEATLATDASKLGGVDASQYVQRSHLHGSSTWNGAGLPATAGLRRSGQEIVLESTDDTELWADDKIELHPDRDGDGAGQVWIGGAVYQKDGGVELDGDVRIDGALDVNGAVAAFQPLTTLARDKEYSAPTDGFLYVYVYNAQVSVHIEGAEIGTLETDEDPSGPENDNQAATFPVAKGESFEVKQVAVGGSAVITVRWRGIGLNQIPFEITP